ncbi:MAG: pilus assembly protein [Bryobacterales bacterium]|nr:pilus assembly protein [Bryobacterales bacterium]
MSKLLSRGRRGHALVEAAFVLVPLVALILAIADFGFATFLRATMQHAVREGTRYGVTFQLKPGKCQDDSIKDVVTEQAMGFLAGASNRNRIKVRYYHPDTFAEITTSAANSPGNILEVSIEGYDYVWLAPLMRSAVPLAIAVRSSDRLEGLGGSMTRPCK